VDIGGGFRVELVDEFCYLGCGCCSDSQNGWFKFQSLVS